MKPETIHKTFIDGAPFYNTTQPYAAGAPAAAPRLRSSSYSRVHAAESIGWERFSFLWP